MDRDPSHDIDNGYDLYGSNRCFSTMKIVVHESITAGGLSGSRVAPTLLAEGQMMLEALLTDLLPLEAHQLSVQIDRRYLPQFPVHPRLQVVDSGNNYYQCLAQMVGEADAALLIAPETGGLLESITGMVEACGKSVLGSSTAGIKAAGDKMQTYRLLKAYGIPTPRTLRLQPADDPASIGRELGYPVVVKPIDGVGCHGVCVARRQSELERTVAAARQKGRGATLLAQAYIDGVAASVSLLTDGSRSCPLTLNLQEIRGRSRLRYHGGSVPFDHPLRALAFRRAEEVVRAIPGLKGYVGIDLVLTDHDAVVIEVNPRITTSYVGVRKILRQNPAALILDAVAGTLPDPAAIQIVGSVRFTTRSCDVRSLGSRQ
ncbi:ATP-grasp domain-containing protein [Candidatus Methylomirabilis sp.]|uniref:ATP-grasp domain-containing protein n=1 Tax=Candidatus Methylomirabilis sp. TaxID=2032687 RepID=UPI002A5C4DAC|nr:ATP-grasp domain-containing protein [Candidatus Methylomirabilis sp.]